MSVEQQLSRIPERKELIKEGFAKQVSEILSYMADEFPQGDIMAKAQDEGVCWKWYVDIPMEIPEVIEHAVRDAMSEKWFDRIHFNGYSTQVDGHTRVSLTINKSDAK